MTWFDKLFRRPDPSSPPDLAPLPEAQPVPRPGPEIDMQALRRALHDSEDRRRYPYRDTVGKLSIGVGRNLDDVGLREDEIDYLLDNDLRDVLADLDRALSWWRDLDGVRQLVLAEMCFNLGLGNAAKGTGLLGFTNTLEAIRERRFDAAAGGMLRSKWAGQVGDRADRLARMMRTGRMEA